MDVLDNYLRNNRDRFVEELKAFLRIPSVSADPAFHESVAQAAQYVADRLNEVGCSVEMVATAGNPIVLGKTPCIDGAPTILVYGHYDVQPAVVSDGWDSDPFEPVVREDTIYARGATDDKGQLYTHIKSLDVWQNTKTPLGVNLIYVIEGEEEVGSDHLDEFLTQRSRDLACDVAVISDTSQYGPGMPAITYGLRGIVAAEVTIEGPKNDLHSGLFGGAIVNPANELCRLISSLHDGNGRVTIAGFYDDVDELSDAERTAFSELPFDDQAFYRNVGVGQGGGESGYSILEQRWARPTCDVNGLTSGYQGTGPKTIIPARSSAKITCRLVPRQSPQAILESLQRHFEVNASPGVRVKVVGQHGAPGVVFDPHSPFMESAKTAIATAFGTEPVLIREGGSIPVVESFQRILGVDTMLLGWGQNTDNLHGPNEHFSLADFERGIRASTHLWAEFAKIKRD